MIVLWGILISSLLGSVHCAGMCGGFVCFYGRDAGHGAAPPLRSHAAYNLGRLFSYLLLGVLAGSLGLALDRAGLLAGVSRLAAIVAGTMMLTWGGLNVLAARGIRVPLPSGGQRVQAWLGAILRRLRDSSPTARALATGVLTTLLPCGWLYAFVALAGGTGSAGAGAAVMLFFWMGTVPMMVSIGLGAQRLFGSYRRRLPALTAAVVMVLGLLSITGHLRAPAFATAHTTPQHDPR